jgi:hypothetical protein
MQKVLQPLRQIQLHISCLLFLILSQAKAQNTDSLLINYIKNYKPKYECNGTKYTIPRFSNIDTSLYSKIEYEFKNRDFNSLYLLIVPIKINHNHYLKKFKQDFIIDDGLFCQEKSIIRLIRIAMKDSLFVISKSSYELETTGDILYWVEVNKNKIVNYDKIDTFFRAKKRIKK